MKFRMLDASGDWQFGSGQQSYAKDLQALMLDLKTRILSWAGDCFFDTAAGIDWKNLLDYNQKKNLSNAIKNIAFRTAGVLNVESINVKSTSNRTAQVNMTVDTIFGTKAQSVINLAV